MHPYRIVLADDHVLFRQGIKRIIEEHEDLEIVGETGDGLELLVIVKRLVPNLVILDISMPKLRGIEAASEIKRIHPLSRILILTMHANLEYLYHAFSAGAEGYLLKEDADVELFSAIKAIREGKNYVSPQLSEGLTEDILKSVVGKGQNPFDRLTTREREILKLIADGKPSREVAELLFISVRTVEHHRASIMKKLNIRTSADLVKYAIRKGYSSLDYAT